MRGGWSPPNATAGAQRSHTHIGLHLEESINDSRARSNVSPGSKPVWTLQYRLRYSSNVGPPEGAASAGVSAEPGPAAGAAVAGAAVKLGPPAKLGPAGGAAVGGAAAKLGPPAKLGPAAG